MADNKRRLRGIIKNAVVWGAGWGVLGFLTTLTLGVAGVNPGIGVLDAIGMGVRIGVVGGIAGAIFSPAIAYVYRGKRIRDISSIKVGLGGAALSAIGLPLLMESASLLTGGGLVPWGDINTDVAIFAAFGGVVAAVSMRMAQMATKRDDEPEVHELASGDADIPMKQQRARQGSALHDEG